MGKSFFLSVRAVLVVLVCTSLVSCFGSARLYDGCQSALGTSRLFDIRSFGAVDEAHSPPTFTPSVNSKALAAAFDTAVAWLTSTGGSGPAFVYVPPGTFVTGSFNLSSHVLLCLADGAQLYGSNDAADYALVISDTSDTGPFDYPLVFAFNCTNTGVVGSGSGVSQGGINGGLNDPPGNHISSYSPSLNYLYPQEWALPGCMYFSCRPKLFVARASDSLLLQGLSIANSALWTITLSSCTNITVDSVVVTGSRQYPNNDGLDCISCSLLSVTNSVFSTGDDNIAIINHSPVTMHDIFLHNLTLSSTSAALKVAVYEAGAAGVVGVVASNITIMDSNRGICLDPRWGGGALANFSFSDMTIETHYFSAAWWGAAEPVYVTSCWQSEEHAWSGGVSDVKFHDLRMHSESGMLFYANVSQAGVSPLSSITVSDCSLVVDRFSNVSSPQHDFRPSVAPQQIFNVTVDGVYVDGASNLTLTNTKIAFANPLQPFYGACVAVAPGSSVTQSQVLCANEPGL